ncbi:mitochondrial outer membrane protein IML2 [Mycena pura]|uniref:Mitochondrial outer membrane protein IML2 n=1 Tax=Mycena pura TaxID=153505 RepID=A0AAD6V657_9AGAR|nr:mitochondrial outer membrane protein IML2 [Mycena pura]
MSSEASAPSAPSSESVPSQLPGSSDSAAAAVLASAKAGFDHLFANQIGLARTAFGTDDSPFHLLGLGVCAFLEAALGMETGLMAEAARLLTASEAGSKRALAAEKKRVKEAGTEKAPAVRDGGGRFAAGLEYEILTADAVVLLGLTHALSESYMGYLQCMYSLNAAHSKFGKLYKTVFPAGLDAYRTPSPSRRPSNSNLAAAAQHLLPLPSASASTLSVAGSTSTSGASLLVQSANASTTALALSSTSTASSNVSPITRASENSPAPASKPPTITKSIFGRWGTSSSSSLSVNSNSKVDKEKADREAKEREEREHIEREERERAPQGPVEELIVSGTAFGFGLFNLVFSLLPKKVQSLVGFLGFKHDRALALRALAVSAGVSTLSDGGDGAATGTDVHGVFAGLVLMTFHGVVLLLSGYQADEARTIRTYRAIVDSIESRYPTGSLWILNRAKILRMSNDAPGAISVLQRGLEAPQTFVQADTLLVFELAWTLLAQRRHQEAADAFVRLTELNSWSHATYYFIAAGCYMSLGDRAKAQELLDALPELLSKKKVGGKDLPTEVFIRKKLEFYKEKQKRRGGDPARFVECIHISTADACGINTKETVWNTHQRIADTVAEAHIKELAALTPPVAIAVPSPFLPAIDQQHASVPDLDTPDESALRFLLLGILHRTLRLYAPARALLQAAHGTQAKVSTWIAGVALFELAVLELKEAQGGGGGGGGGPASAPAPAAAGLADAGAGAGTLAATDKAGWARVAAAADARLDAAQGFAGRSDIDLSSRLDSRIALLRDQIAAKRAMVGI